MAQPVFECLDVNSLGREEPLIALGREPPLARAYDEQRGV
jgi:hypothetical protein